MENCIFPVNAIHVNFSLTLYEKFVYTLLRYGDGRRPHRHFYSIFSFLPQLRARARAVRVITRPRVTQVARNATESLSYVSRSRVMT